MNLRQLTLVSMLIALSVIGANIRFVGSIAMDSFPAYLGSILLGAPIGGIIGILGHLISAVLSGFPFGLYAHLITAVFMGISVYTYGKVVAYYNKTIKGVIMASLASYLINVIIALIVLAPLLSSAVSIALVGPLTVAYFVNIIVTYIVFEVVEKRLHIFSKSLHR